MEPSVACDYILESLKQSNLHFILTENPFSARITIRKKFVNDQNNRQFLQVENKKVFMKSKVICDEENAKLEYENSNLIKVIEDLKDNLANSLKIKNECMKHLNDQRVTYMQELDAVKQAKEALANNNKGLLDEVLYLELNNKRLKTITKRLNSEVSEIRLKLKKEKLEAIGDLKVEIKHWKKKLGWERKEKMKLVKKLGKLSPTLDQVTFETTKVNEAFSHAHNTILHPKISLKNNLELDPNLNYVDINLSHKTILHPNFADTPSLYPNLSNMSMSTSSLGPAISLNSCLDQNLFHTTNLDQNLSHKLSTNLNKSPNISLDLTASPTSHTTFDTMFPNNNSMDTNINITNCCHVPQCILRHPNPPPPFGPITSYEFYCPITPPPNIRLLPYEVPSFKMFQSLRTDHQCEDCAIGALYHNYHEMVHYPDPGPCRGTSGSQVMSCPNNPNTSITIIENKKLEKKKYKKRSFQCD